MVGKVEEMAEEASRDVVEERAEEASQDRPIPGIENECASGVGRKCEGDGVPEIGEKRANPQVQRAVEGVAWESALVQGWVGAEGGP